MNQKLQHSNSSRTRDCVVKDLTALFVSAFGDCSIKRGHIAAVLDERDRKASGASARHKQLSALYPKTKAPVQLNGRF